MWLEDVLQFLASVRRAPQLRSVEDLALYRRLAEVHPEKAYRIAANH
jgi:hypothetical protein